MSAWLNAIFNAGQVNKGNIVRRRKRDVNRYASMADLEAEGRRRGFHLVEIGDQVVVICNRGNVRLISLTASPACRTG